MTHALTIDRIPTPLMAKFSGAEIAVLRYLYYLLNITKVRSRDQQPQVTPSEQHLAAKLHISLRTVQRAISKARYYQLLWIRQFKAQAGKWYTNMYRIHRTYLSLIRRVRKSRENKHPHRAATSDALKSQRDDLTTRAAQDSGPEPGSGGPAGDLSDDEKDAEVREWLRARGIGRN